MENPRIETETRKYNQNSCLAESNTPSLTSHMEEALLKRGQK